MEFSSGVLPAEILERDTPSVTDGISRDIETSHRIYGCQLIQEAGILLRLPQVVMVTGQNILNRFFYRKSLRRFDVFSVAMGCILLSAKVEESFKTLREIYMKRKKLKIKPMELGGEQYTLWKGELITIERYILKELGFYLYNIRDHPHKYILYFIKILNGSKELAQLAWNYLNDSMRLDLSLRYEAADIACAAIFLACRKLHWVLPDSWWEVMDVPHDTLLLISDSILSIYHMEQAFWLEPIATVKYLSEEVTKKFDEYELEQKIPSKSTPTETVRDSGHDSESKAKSNSGQEDGRGHSNKDRNSSTEEKHIQGNHSRRGEYKSDDHRATDRRDNSRRRDSRDRDSRSNRDRNDSRSRPYNSRYRNDSRERNNDRNNRGDRRRDQSRERRGGENRGSRHFSRSDRSSSPNRHHEPNGKAKANGHTNEKRNEESLESNNPQIRKRSDDDGETSRRQKPRTEDN